ncbi:MAG: hypothetical protein RR263_00240 [Oscillospiraceae bacterium]
MSKKCAVKSEFNVAMSISAESKAVTKPQYAVIWAPIPINTACL